MMRAGEVLETVPGVVISQHSGEGKANQYYLRGFNLDHGTDFATTVAGMPVNMPTHGHGHGYSDLNFLIPELVSGVQFSKGPYFADQGDFATAGAANINYTQQRWRGRSSASAGGGQGFGRALAAASHAVGRRARCSARVEVQHNDGPWVRAGRLPQGQRLRALQPGRHAERLLDHRHGLPRPVELDRSGAGSGRSTTGGSAGSAPSTPPTAATRTATAARSSGSARATTPAPRSRAFGLAYDLNLFSNFTYFLDDPDNGDQFHQADHRFVIGRQGHASPARPAGAAGRSRTSSACSCATTTSATSGCITR